MKIGLVAPDLHRQRKDFLGRPLWSGGTWVRLVQYSKFFTEMKIPHVCGVLMKHPKFDVLGVADLQNRVWFDCEVLLIQRYMDATVCEAMGAAQAEGQIFINDVDDWFWGLSKKNLAYKVTDPNINKEANRDIYANILAKSDGLIASTDFLFNKLKKWNDNTVVHGNYVDLSLFTPPVEQTPKERITVGWLGSTAHRSGDLEILRPHSLEISKFADWHHTGHSAGSDFPTFADELGLHPNRVSCLGYQNPMDLKSGMKFDVGIVPLTNVHFNHAKSFLKGIEYAAAGVPFVASWSPEYERLKEEYNIGVVVSDPADYVKELKKFCDFDYRLETAKVNRERVKVLDTSVGAIHLHNAITEIYEAV